MYALSFQAQSQGSITLKIIPATQEEDRLKESKVWWGRRAGLEQSWAEIARLLLRTHEQWRMNSVTE